jgi:hypothetical protein
VRARGALLLLILAVTSCVAAACAGPAGAAEAAVHQQVRGSRAAAAALPGPVRCGSCWRPRLRESWQIQLSSVPRAPFLAVQLIETDGFDTSKATVAALHRSRAGRGVVCYIDAGTWENWRPDAKEFPARLLGKKDGGWAGERWLDIAKYRGVLSRIMRARVAMCRRKGFNAVDFDNVDGYTNDTGFRLTYRDQLAYDVFLANTAHRAGLSAALKNDLAQIPRLLRYFDFAVDEQCFQYAECLSSQNGGKYGLNQFVAAGKAVFDIEYALKTARFCPAANRDNFNGLAKKLSLGPWRRPCRGR